MKTYPPVIVEGLEFTIERQPCRKDQWRRYTCKPDPRFIGIGFLDISQSQRIGICKHQEPFDVGKWLASAAMEAQVRGILQGQQRQAERESLERECQPSLKDAVWWASPYRADSFMVRLGGLTRTQAVRIYKLARTARDESSVVA